jgi:tRNA-modifying protein YgfZ
MPFRLQRAFIRVAGPDAIGFLDNLLTQDVTRLKEAGVLYAALLTPQGKIISDMFLWTEKNSDAPSVLIELDVSRLDDLIRRLTLYKLRANVSIESVTDRVHALYDTSALGHGTPDPRFPSFELGWRDFAPFATDEFNFANGMAALDAHRIALGVPDLARDAAPEEVFALEGLLEELNGVDFQKGCFVGQENVSRMKRRATTRKKFCPVVFDGAPPPHGAKITAGDAEVGSVRSGIEGRAIALLRLDRALESQAAGTPLIADGKVLRLDPPPWLVLPDGGA